MALDAILVLETLHCIRQADLPLRGGTEPYIWPVVVRVDDVTLQTDSLVSVVAPTLDSARVLIKDDMRAGQSAGIPSSVGVLRVRLEDNLFATRLILVVALWDQDDTPKAAVRAGFQAFVSGLGAALGDINTLLALKDAEDAIKAAKDDLKEAQESGDQARIEAAEQGVREAETRQDAVTDAIEDQVTKRVESAIRNSLTGPQKVAVLTGFLSVDDLLGSAFKSFNAVPLHINLTFGKDKPNEFEIHGSLDLREVRVDRCQAQVNAVRNAQSGVDEVKQAIRALQNELAKAPDSEKPFLRSQIERLREEDLAFAEAALGQALTALSICRSRVPPRFPEEAEQ